MMDGATILVVFIFLLVVAVLAGIGIGLVIGLVLWGRSEDQTSMQPQQAAAGSVRTAPTQAVQSLLAERPVPGVALDSLAPVPEPDSATIDEQTGPQSLPDAMTRIDEPLVAPVTTTVAAARPARRTQSWSVGLAVGVIIICCICTFLLAALTALNR